MPHDKTNEDHKLIAGCKKQDHTCQKRLFEKYYGAMLGICMRYTGSREEAKDVMQDGFIKAFSKLDTFHFEVNFYFWLRRIMINTAIDRHRRLAVRGPELPLNEEVLSGGHEAEVMQRLGAEDIIRLLQTLPVKAREVFNLRVIEGYSHEEIAEIMNITRGTSRSQLNYARKLLQEKLQPAAKKKQHE